MAILASTIISRMHNIFNNLLRRTKDLIIPARAYLATPIGKITLVNSVLFVHIFSCSWCGQQRGFPKSFSCNISPLNESTSHPTGSTLLSHMRSRIFLLSISVYLSLSRFQYAGTATFRQTGTGKIRQPICLGPLFGWSLCRLTCHELLHALWYNRNAQGRSRPLYLNFLLLHCSPKPKARSLYPYSTNSHVVPTRISHRLRGGFGLQL